MFQVGPWPRILRSLPRTRCSSLTAKKDHDVLVLLLHALNNIPRLFGLCSAIGHALCTGTVAIPQLGRLCPQPAFCEVGKGAEDDEDEDDEIGCVEHRSRRQMSQKGV
jgi:hypothetical protein